MAEEARFDTFEQKRNPGMSTGLRDREYGSYRASGRHPRDSAVAVVGDMGEAIGSNLEILFEELIYEIRLLRFALSATEMAADLGDLDDL